MVGYIPEAEVNLSKREYALVGATSSAISRVVSQPLDVIKIRFQVKLIMFGFSSSSSIKVHVLTMPKCVLSYCCLW